VILAVPPSRWSSIQFSPGLPPFLNPQMGKNIKFLMGLKRQFWVDDNLGPEFSSDGPINLTWESTANQSAIADASALAAFSGGEDAEKCREWTPKERRRKYLYELGRFYMGVRRSVVKDRFEDWPANEWVKASYAFPRPDEILKCGRFLSEGRGRLHFAGEHTCYAFIGYMEGALQSGLRVAERLAKRDGVI